MDYFMFNLYFFATWILIAVGIIVIIIKLPTNANMKNESEVLNIPRVSGSYPTANDIWSVARTDDMLTFRKWYNKHFGNYR